MAPVARLQNFVRTFGDVRVIKGLNLDIEPGEFIALLGRSGCGKTTLLRTLAGLDEATSGTVVAPSRRAVVFQEPRLVPWKRVWRNVALGLRKRDSVRHAIAALEEVGLAHRTQAWPLTLSGGEAQRVGLARAMVRDPDLLLLDEPFAALDALTRMRMQQMVLDLHRVHGPAVLLVTHDVDEALLLADRAVVMADGVIVDTFELTAPRPRDISDPELGSLRRRRLAALGVSVERVALQ